MDAHYILRVHFYEKYKQMYSLIVGQIFQNWLIKNKSTLVSKHTLILIPLINWTISASILTAFSQIKCQKSERAIIVKFSVLPKYVPYKS